MPASLFDAIVKLNFESVAAQLYASLPREEGEICYLTLLEHAIVFFVVQRALNDTTALVRREGLGGLYKRTAGVILSFAKAAIPGVSGLVAGEEKKALADLEKDLLGEGDPDAMPTMPAEGFSVKEVERRVMKMQDEEVAAAGEGEGGATRACFYRLESACFLFRRGAPTAAARRMRPKFCGTALHVPAPAFASRCRTPRPTCGKSWSIRREESTCSTLACDRRRR